MKVYALAKGWVIFILVFTVPFALGVLYYLFLYGLPGIFKRPDAVFHWFFSGGALICIAFCYYAIIEAVKGKFVIDTDRVYLNSALGTRELRFSEIKGYRTDDKYIHIEPLETEKRKLKITVYFSNTAEIIEWLDGRYPDLDQQEKGEKHRRILADDTYGVTKEERVLRLNQAKKIAKMINIAGIAIAVAVLFFGQGASVSVAAAIAAPVIFLWVLKMYKGLIRIGEQKNSPYPSVIFGLFAPIAALLLRSLLAYDILDYSGIWNPAVLIALLFFCMMVIGTPELKSDKLEIWLGKLVLLAISFAYSFGVVVALNCQYDDSEPEQYRAVVMGKSISGSKSKSYYLKLSKWGPRTASEDVNVSQEVYHRLDVNSPVNIYLYQGKLKIPWFFVTD